MQKKLLLQLSAGALVAIASFVAVKLYLASNGKPSPSGGPSGSSPVITPEFAREAWAFEADGKTIDTLSDIEQRRYQQHIKWATEVEFARTDTSLDEFRRNVFPVNAIKDGGGVLDAQRLHALSAAVARFYWLRTRHDYSEYLRAVEHSPALALNDNARTHPQAASFFHFFMEQKYVPDHYGEAFVRTLWDSLREWNHFPVEFGIGQRGRAVTVLRIRSESQLGSHGLSGRYAVEDPEWWMGGAYRESIRLSQPARSVSEIISREGFADAAFCHVVVRYPDGKVGNWHAIWVYDPDGLEWIPHRSTMSSFRTLFTVN